MAGVAEVMARGGGGTWVTGSYDPELNLLYWGTGNPNPDYYGDDRKGDNLYTGVDHRARRRHRQAEMAFPVHAARHPRLGLEPCAGARRHLTIGGQPRKVVMVANRNGFFYVLDRVTGKLLLGKPFTDTTWARELGPDGHPIVLNDGSKGCLPDQWGGTNYNAAVFRSGAAAVFRHGRETCAAYLPEKQEIAPGRVSNSGTVRRDRREGLRRAARDRRGDGRAANGSSSIPTPTHGGGDVDGVRASCSPATTKVTSWLSRRDGQEPVALPDRFVDLGRLHR